MKRYPTVFRSALQVLLSALCLTAAELVHFDFEEATGGIAQDRSGNNRHGLLRNGAKWASGYQGRGTGVSFEVNGADGTAGSARVSVPVELSLPAGSISLWYYVTPYYDFHTILDNEVSDNDWEMWVQQSDRHPETPRWYKGLRFRTGGDAQARDIGRVTCNLDTLTKEGTGGPNQWYYVVVTWAEKPTVKDGVTYRYATHLYVNGKLRDYAGTNNRSVLPGDSVHLGGKKNPSKGNGVIDEFRVFDVELTASVIDSLYRAYTGGAVATGPSAGLVRGGLREAAQTRIKFVRHCRHADLPTVLTDGRMSLRRTRATGLMVVKSLDVE